MRPALYVLALVAALPLFWIAGTIAANPLTEPDFEGVDLADPPLDLALLGAWARADGELACRAFYHRHLTANPESLPPIRYTVSGEEFARCSEAFLQYSRDRRWLDEFDWDRPGFLARVQRPNPDDPNLFVVTYQPEDDRFAETRYRIDPLTAEPTDFEFRGYFGPARGIAILFLGGAAGTVAWVLLVTCLTIRHLRRRTTRSITTGTPQSTDPS